jgi:hypothetical protein
MRNSLRALALPLEMEIVFSAGWAINFPFARDQGQSFRVLFWL